MADLTSGHLAQLGMIYLETAILDVLFENSKKGEEGTPASISKRLGIPRSEEARNYPIVYGILCKLAEVDGRVERCPDRKSSWRLTMEEFRNWR